jgi:Spy/CpxP family protein refolding chaperone
MRSLGCIALPVTLVMALPALGCGGSTVSEQVASADSAMTRAPVATNAHGPLKFIGEALGEVPLSPAQRTEIEKMAADADTRHADARAARRDLMLALADQVQAGQVDRNALTPKVDGLAAALGRAQPADRASFEQLHALLNADQRTAFVNALEARIGERRSDFREKHPLKQWADDLKLSDAQKQQIRTALRDHFRASGHAHGGDHVREWEGHGQHAAKVLAAFKSDRFVMDEVAPAKDLGKAAGKMSERFLGMAETVVPLLTPEQRAIAAQKIRAKADAADAIGPGL